MSDKPTFAGLKKRLRDEVQPAGLTVRTVMLETVRELEALEQRVRKLLDELERSGGKGADGFYRYSINVENQLTALLGDKP